MRLSAKTAALEMIGAAPPPLWMQAAIIWTHGRGL